MTFVICPNSVVAVLIQCILENERGSYKNDIILFFNKSYGFTKMTFGNGYNQIQISFVFSMGGISGW